MYIPITLFGAGESCTQIAISGSSLPTNIEFGQIDSGSETSYFWIKCEANQSMSFDVINGSTTAKLLAIGGGGGATAYQVNPSATGDSNTGGGGAGQVIFQDIQLQPGLNYYMSASIGGRSTTPNGGNSVFIENYDITQQQNWRTHTAQGGQDNNQQNGGNSVGFTGGTGITGTLGAGGGGAGSYGNGGDAQQITNYSIGGDSGAPTPIPYPFSSVVGDNKVAAGGRGQGYSGQDGTLINTPYGDGASRGSSPFTNGDDGAVFLFIPIEKCELVPTGAIVLPEDEPFEAIGGDIVGTFTSGSRDYKYHIFTNSGYFSVKSGYNSEAKVMVVGGGAHGPISPCDSYIGSIDGGAGAGGVSIKRDYTLYGTFNVKVGGVSSCGQKNGYPSFFKPISQYINFTTYAYGGGIGSYTQWNGSFFRKQNGEAGGSGGGGSATAGGYYSPGGVLTPSGVLGYYDESLGNNGGSGYTTQTSYLSGGGGGASGPGQGSAGQGAGGDGYILDGEFFPYTVLFTSPEIARGGPGEGSPYTRPIQDHSGDGGDFDGGGASGFVCITYPIS